MQQIWVKNDTHSANSQVIVKMVMLRLISAFDMLYSISNQATNNSKIYLLR